ncbi:MAG: hypothetical protein Tsb002_12350 [Wenzhouxiangellaceae bacterium]
MITSMRQLLARRRWWRRLFYLLLPLLILALGAMALLWWALHTNSGARWLVYQLNQHLPALQIDDAAGSLDGGLQLSRVRYRDEAIDASIAELGVRLDMDWLPWPELTINHLRGSNIDVQLLPAETPAEPFTPPSIELPIPIIIDELMVRQLQLATAEQDPLLTLQRLDGRLTYDDQLIVDRLTIQQLASMGASLDLNLNGEVALTPPYQHELTLTGDGAVQLAEGANNSEPASQAITLQLLSRGSTDHWQATLSGNGQQLFTELQLALEGRTLLRQPQLSADLNWQQLQWPPGGNQIVASDGLIEISGDWPQLVISGQWQQQQPHMASGDWQLNLQQMDEQQWRLEQLAATLPSLQLAATGDAQLDSRQGQLTITLGDIDPASINPALSPLGSWQGQIEAAFNDQRLSLKQARFNADEQAGQLTLDGHYSLDDQSLRLHSRWRDLLWRDEQRDLRSDQGEVVLNGSLNDYRLQGSLSLATAELPAGQVRLNGRGDQQQFTLEQLDGDWLEGQFSANGAVTWAPEIDWQAQFNASEINLAPLAPGFDSRINTQLSTRGQSDESGLQAAIQIEQLDGTLQGRPLSGEGELLYRDGALSSDGLELRSGDSRLQLQSTDDLPASQPDAGSDPTQQQALRWQLQAPALEQWHATASGGLRAQGWLRLTDQQLSGELDASSQNAGWGEWSLADSQINAQWSLPLSGLNNADLGDSSQQETWSVQAEIGVAAILQDDARMAEQLRIVIAGEPEQQTLEMQLAARGQSLELSIHGDELRSQPWQFAGEVRQLNWNSPEQGEWRLQEASGFTVADASLSLPRPLCLRTADGNDALCLQATTTADRQQVEVNLTDINMARFNRLLRPYALRDMNASGQISVILDQTQVEQLQARVDISPGQITGGQQRRQSSTNADQHRFAVDGLTLTANAEATTPLNLKARLQTEGEGLVDIETQVMNWQRPDDATLDGQLQLRWAELETIRQLLPQIDRLAGRLEADWRFSGPWRQPNLQGQLRLSEGRWAEAATGLELRQTELSLTSGSSSELQLSGSAMMGDGRVQLEGRFNPPQRELTVSVRGEQLRLMDGVNGSLWASPDIQVDISGRQLNIDGELRIPRARLTPIAMTNQVSTSPDVVLAGDDSADDTMPMTMNGGLRITLGDDIAIDADSVNAGLSGQLQLAWNGPLLPNAEGRIQLEDAGVRAYGQNLDVNRGLVLFEGGPADNPRLDIRAARRIFGDALVEQAGISIQGTATNPRVRLYTQPSTNQERALSYLLTGSNFDHANGEGALSVGIYLLPRLLVSYGFGLFENGNVASARYELSDQWSVQAQSGARDTGVDISWSVDR